MCIRDSLLPLALAALGVVYGDIGTSPIYAVRESLHGVHGVSPTSDNVLGLLSLVFWALIVVISIKYLAFVMRADNCGEGGMIALTALVSPPSERPELRAARARSEPAAQQGAPRAYRVSRDLHGGGCLCRPHRTGTDRDALAG